MPDLRWVIFDARLLAVRHALVMCWNGTLAAFATLHATAAAVIAGVRSTWLSVGNGNERRSCARPHWLQALELRVFSQHFQVHLGHRAVIILSAGGA
ncbi:MAG TPA: hypothetical protein VJS89_04800 [Gammaproteobacteria bacterium]|nr:hypothetical protein [Gammaproteobacteria bacterium]